MHILRIDDARPDPIEQSRLKRLDVLATEAEKDAAELESHGRWCQRQAATRRRQAARIRATILAAAPGHPETAG